MRRARAVDPGLAEDERMIQRLARLSFRELLDLWPALWRLAMIRISLFRGIARTRQRFGGSSDSPNTGKLSRNRDQASTPPLAAWRRRALALRRVSRFIPGAHCLARALALRWWMRRSGLEAVVVIGVRRTADGIASHAWVELEGIPIDESEAVIRNFQVISQDHLPSGGWTR